MVGSALRQSSLKLFSHLPIAVITILLVCSIPGFVVAQCSLTSPTTWVDGNGDWNTGVNWSLGIPTGSTNACITDGTSAVSLGISEGGSVASLQLASGNSLTLDYNSSLYLYGPQLINAGQINIDAANGYNAILYIQGNTTLSGGGTINLSSPNGTAYLYLNGANLDNVDNTIQGYGLIYNPGTVLTNEAAGTINANVSGSALNLYYGTVNNAGQMEATNGGVLNLNATYINNGGGNITASGPNSVVNIYGGTVIAGGTLNNIGAAFLGTPVSSTASLNGSTGAGAITLNGTYTTDYNGSTYLYGSIQNNGNFQMNALNGYNSTLYIQGNTTLTGGGTVTLNSVSGNAYLDLNAANLDNVNNTIQGNGIIFNNGTVLTNEAAGVVNANVSGAALNVYYGTVNNAGLLEATNGGTLVLTSTTVNNGGANITAGPGSSVVLEATDIVGGTLNNNGAFLGTPISGAAYLDGSTGAGAITLNGTYTIDYNGSTSLYGSIQNNGNFQVNALNGYNSTLYVGSNVTLTNSGTVTLNSVSGTAYLYLNGANLDNVNNTIQGNGIIDNNGTVFTNEAAGVVNANVSGAALNVYYGTVNNAGLLEATNGGTLVLYNTTVNNAGANITAGPGSAVVLEGSDIVAGTLNNNGVFLGTPAGYAANLDGRTGAVILNGTYTTDYAAATYLFGAIQNNGNFQVNATGGYNSNLYIQSNATLTSRGMVTLNSVSGNAYLYLDSANLDNVNNTIQGNGIIWNNGTVLTNEAAGAINANVPGAGLSLEYGTVNNTGLLEATNGGVLNLYATHVNNAGGNITAGPGSYVQIYGGATITGGTLNNGGVFLGTPAGNTAVLDGSAGAVTINGTYTTDYNGATYLYGTINNHGDLSVLARNGYDSYLYVQSNTTLTGGGTLTLNSVSGTARLYLNGANLDNIDNTVQGYGLIWNNGTTLTNEAAGTILANVPGSGLTVYYGTINNLGTMQVNAGSYVQQYYGNLSNFAGNTLTGGTYNIYGTTSNAGTLQIFSLGTTGGEIVNNAATILLDGPNSNFVDQAGLDALSNLSNNTAAGTFTIRDGRNFTSPGDFANAGTVAVGAGSTFTTTGNYNQSGGNTYLGGTLTAAGGSVNINGGTFSPGSAPNTAGAAVINGNYVQTAAGIFQLDIGGTVAGSTFDLLMVNGQAYLDGTLDISLINGFMPSNLEVFHFLVTDPGVFGVFATVNQPNLSYGSFIVEYLPVGNADYVELVFNGTAPPPIPEPSTFLMLGSGLIGAAYTARRRWLK